MRKRQSPSTQFELTSRGRIVACLAALAAAAAWLGDNPNARLAAAMLAAPLIVDFVLKPRGLHRAILRIAPRRTSAGALFTETVSIEHTGRRPLREGLLVEPRTMRAESPTLLPSLHAGEPASIELRARAPNRSRVSERIFVLASLWPLALFRARGAVAVATDFVIEPARIPLPIDVERSVGADHAAHDAGDPHPHGEFHSLREHVVGEDAGGVHALRSAAVGSLVRRVCHGADPKRVGLVLDLRRPAGRTASRGSPRFEWGMSACASLVTALRRRDVDVHVLVLGTDTEEVLVDDAVKANELLTLLAAAAPTPHPAGAPRLDALQRLPRCYWIAAGGPPAANEIASLGKGIVFVEGSDG